MSTMVFGVDNSQTLTKLTADPLLSATSSQVHHPIQMYFFSSIIPPSFFNMIIVHVSDLWVKPITSAEKSISVTSAETMSRKCSSMSQQSVSRLYYSIRRLSGSLYPVSPNRLFLITLPSTVICHCRGEAPQLHHRALGLYMDRTW